MKWLRHRTVVTVGLLVFGTTLLFLGWYQKRGYLDLMATGAKAIEEARFDNLDFERAEGNLFAAKDLIAYNRGVRASAAGRFAPAARHFQEVLFQSQSPTLRANAHYNLGNLLTLQGNLREAVKMYREALRLDPWNWDAKANLEKLYAQVQGPEEERANASLKPAQEPREPGDERGQSGSESEKAGI